MSLEHGVGGVLTQFALYEVGNPQNQVIFESAPARRSFHDKQGQTVPGVGAGMDFMLNTNLAKLNVPGGMPIYQPMGIAEERIEFVGAFIGFDEYMEDSTGKPVFDNAQDKNKSDLNAWQKAQLLFEAARKQRLLALKMSWPHLNIEYENTVNFRGYLKSVVRTLATAQRVYYRVLFVVDPEMVSRKIAPQTAQGSTGATAGTSARPGTGGGNGNADPVSEKKQKPKGVPTSRVPPPPTVPGSFVVPSPPTVPGSFIVPSPPTVPGSFVVPSPPTVPGSFVVPSAQNVPGSSVTKPKPVSGQPNRGSVVPSLPIPPVFPPL
jgi:hypothetical protein